MVRDLTFTPPDSVVPNSVKMLSILIKILQKVNIKIKFFEWWN